MTVISFMPLFPILVSLFCALLTMIFRKSDRAAEMITIVASITKFALIVSMLPQVLAGKIIELNIIQILPDLFIKLRVDSLAIYFALVASFLWIITSVYSIGYMRASGGKSLARYYGFFAVSLSATIGAAFSANLLTLFIFYEILTLVTYPLVTHDRTREAIQAGRKYLIYLIGGGALLLFAILMTYGLTGTLDFHPAGFLGGYGISPVLLKIIFILFIFGFTKAAIMPLHAWLPAAMVAPTPVSALLHAVAVVKVGVFGLVRVVCNVYGIEVMSRLGLGVLLAAIASVTIIIASVYALKQDNLKLRLAYSTISQLSYVALGIGLLSPAGLTGGVIQIANHAFAKITLFFCAGSIYVATHKKKISEFGGLAKKMPVTMAAFSIAALSMIGIPPMSGFVTKWFIGTGVLYGQQPIFIIVLVGSSILNAAYFLPIIYTAYFDASSSEQNEKQYEIKEKAVLNEPNLYILLPLLGTAFISIILGIFAGLPGLPLSITQLARWVIF